MATRSVAQDYHVRAHAYFRACTPPEVNSAMLVQRHPCLLKIVVVVVVCCCLPLVVVPFVVLGQIWTKWPISCQMLSRMAGLQPIFSVSNLKGNSPPPPRFLGVYFVWQPCKFRVPSPDELIGLIAPDSGSVPGGGDWVRAGVLPGEHSSRMPLTQPAGPRSALGNRSCQGSRTLWSMPCYKTAPKLFLCQTFLCHATPMMPGSARKRNVGEQPSEATPLAPQPTEQRTNGWIIRTFGRRLRLRDSTLEVVLWCVLSTVLLPYLIIQLIRGLRRRPGHTVRQYMFQLFGCCGSLPTLPPSVGVEHAADPAPGRLRFVVMSDTHMQHRRLRVPAGDVLVHCGDFTNHGSLAEVADFAAWFTGQPHPVKILVPGNHDMIMDRAYYEAYWGDWSSVREDPDKALALLEGVHVLIDAAVDVQGLTVYGSPHVPRYAPWQTAFNVEAQALPGHWGRIPRGVDVLVTHCPPRGTLDREPFVGHGGCPHLRTEVRGRVRPAYHVFGHVHSDFGAVEDGGTCYVNAASVSRFYAARQPLCFTVPIPAAGAPP